MVDKPPEPAAYQEEERQEVSALDGTSQPPQASVLEPSATATSFSKPVAERLEIYLAEGGTKLWSPRPEWIHDHAIVRNEARKRRRAFLRETRDAYEDEPQQEQVSYRPKVFGSDHDSALHVAIRQEATEAALELIQLGASVHESNSQGMTPLHLACQKGNLTVVQELWRRGASSDQLSNKGWTPLLIAVHCNRLDIVKFLFEEGDANIETGTESDTTPLMRASYQGHYDMVLLLLKHTATVNRQNRRGRSALMKASSQGHEQVVQLLVKFGARLDATDQEELTALMMACLRGHLSVVKVLVTEGCELWLRDSRGLTAKDMAIQKNAKEIIRLLDPYVQVDLMQRKARVARNYVMILIWKLMQHNRAHVPFLDGYPRIQYMGGAKALQQTMDLTEHAVVRRIASFLPLPRLWNRRSNLIHRSCFVDPDAAIASSFEIIDEVLDYGGFLKACDEAQVMAPINFSSWIEWKSWGLQYKQDDSCSLPPNEPQQGLTLTTLLERVPGLSLAQFNHPTQPTRSPGKPQKPYAQMRRETCFLQLLGHEHQPTTLVWILSKPPYYMPVHLIRQLMAVSHIQSSSRQIGPPGVRFDVEVAIAIRTLADAVLEWYKSYPRCPPEMICDV